MLLPTPAAVRLFHEGAVALAQVEANGLRIDTAYLDQAITGLDGKIKSVQSKLRTNPIYDLWRQQYGEKMKLSSRDQLGEIVFGKLKYPCPGKTATGRYRADEAAFEKIDLPFVKQLLYVEKMKKAKKTYLEGIREETVEGYLHPFIHLNTVTSLRSSSSSPNLQNFPVRDPEFGNMIRRSVIPRDGCVLVEPDFGALEARVIANVWPDENLVKYLSDPTKDIHRDQAAELFLCSPKQVSKTSRYVGKNGFVFPKFYGSYYAAMARAIWLAMEEQKLTVEDIPMREWLAGKGISELGECDPTQKAQPGTYEKHVQGVERRFEKKFPKVFEMQKEGWQQYQKTGEYRLITGFVLKGVVTRNFYINSQIQGPGFHLLLLCLIILQKWLNREQKKSLIIGEIHDCLLLDVDLSELQEVLTMIHRIMTVEVTRRWPWVVVPLVVEIDVASDSWANKKPWHCQGGIWQPVQKS